jgi:hypothetical protein
LQLFFARSPDRLLLSALLVCLHGIQFGLIFAIPIEECGFGDVELIGNASEAPALDTEVEELIYGFGRVHSLYFLEASIGSGVGHLRSYRKSTESLESLNELNG